MAAALLGASFFASGTRGYAAARQVHPAGVTARRGARTPVPLGGADTSGAPQAPVPGGDRVVTRAGAGANVRTRPTFSPRQKVMLQRWSWPGSRS